MADTHDTQVDGLFYPNTLIPHDNDMPNATPTRKMYSSISVGDAQYTEDNRGTSMAGIRALAKAAKTGPGLKNVKTDDVTA